MKNILYILIFSQLFAVAASCAQKVGTIPQTVKEEFLAKGVNIRTESWIEGLQVPWSLVFLSGDRALVSERNGQIRLILDSKLQEKPYALIDTAQGGEGGLMGLAVHPGFPQEPFIYAMYTYRKEGRFYNRVTRLKDKGKSGIIDRVILEGIPGGRLHNGGRIAFGRDNMLYIATGETFRSDLSQDLTSLGGKILRITPEGTIPNDNPFDGSPVYSYGHRNPQGISWHPGTGKLFISEHGPSGEFGHFANDEINVIKKGGNYGWPEVIGAPHIKPYIDPIVVWEKTTPPSGITFYQGTRLAHLRGDLFVSTLKSESLIRIRLGKDGKSVNKIERWFAKDYNNGVYGRIRDVVEGPDGALYFLTNNTDGRGRPGPGDDRIYRIIPE
jgi:quinoprotein glucose dehydrogenase